MDFGQLLEENVILAIFPLHDYSNALKELRKKWVGWASFLRRQPLEEIKEYFGPKIAMVLMAVYDCYNYFVASFD